MTTYRLAKLGDHLFQLEEFQARSDNHSCYACYDSSRSARRNCETNRDKWLPMATGDADWAQITAQHYGLRIP